MKKSIDLLNRNFLKRQFSVSLSKWFQWEGMSGKRKGKKRKGKELKWKNKKRETWRHSTKRSQHEIEEELEEEAEEEVEVEEVEGEGEGEEVKVLSYLLDHHLLAWIIFVFWNQLWVFQGCDWWMGVVESRTRARGTNCFGFLSRGDWRLLLGGFVGWVEQLSATSSSSIHFRWSLRLEACWQWWHSPSVLWLWLEKKGARHLWVFFFSSL